MSGGASRTQGALLTLGLWCAGATWAAEPPKAAETPAEIVDLMRAWSGVHDSAVQVILDDHSPQAAAAEVSRLRTVIEPVDLPWLGPSVLYLEETLHDVPGAPRRQVLLRLSIDSQLLPARIRVRQYTFGDPGRGAACSPIRRRTWSCVVRMSRAFSAVICCSAAMAASSTAARWVGAACHRRTTRSAMCSTAWR